MTRNELAQLFYGVGAELGVAAGEYSLQILSNPKVDRLLSIDRWSDHHDQDEYERACKLLSEFGNRSIVLRQPFSDAAPSIPDAYLDFVYFDGYAHAGQEEGRTLEEWWVKVKPGGIVAGHDYHASYPKNIEEVDWFALKYGLKLHFTETDELPSWYAYKI